MTRTQFDLLMEYIEARAKEVFAKADGRDSLYESVAANEILAALQISGIIKAE